MANIVSAPVGGAVAGQVVIPEPAGAWHFTWPDVVAKTAGDLISGYFDSVRNPDGADEEADYPRGPSPKATAPANSAPAPMLAGGGALLLAAAAVVVFLVIRK